MLLSLYRRMDTDELPLRKLVRYSAIISLVITHTFLAANMKARCFSFLVKLFQPIEFTLSCTVVVLLEVRATLQIPDQSSSSAVTGPCDLYAQVRMLVIPVSASSKYFLCSVFMMANVGVGDGEKVERKGCSLFPRFCRFATLSTHSLPYLTTARLTWKGKLCFRYAAALTEVDDQSKPV